MEYQLISTSTLWESPLIKNCLCIVAFLLINAAYCRFSSQALPLFSETSLSCPLHPLADWFSHAVHCLSFPSDGVLLEFEHGSIFGPYYCNIHSSLSADILLAYNVVTVYVCL